MSLIHRFLLLVLIGCASACASTPRDAGVTRLVPLVSIDLVGTDLYRLSATGREVMTRDEVVTYLRALLRTRDVRSGPYRYTILLHSFDAPPPDTLGTESAHIAPVLGVAREYGCSVSIVHPEQAGPAVVDTYYRAFPSRRRGRQ